jgi:hypothetical protein
MLSFCAGAKPEIWQPIGQMPNFSLCLTARK